MLVLNFAFTISKLDHKYATIILYYYCDQPSSFSQAPSACGVQCSTERLVFGSKNVITRKEIKYCMTT